MGIFKFFQYFKALEDYHFPDEKNINLIAGGLTIVTFGIVIGLIFYGIFA